MQHNQSASDLFCEQFGAAAPCHGNFAEKFSLFGIDAYRGSISDKSSHSGDYVTVDCGCMWLPSFNTESAVRAVAEAVSMLVPRTSDTMRVLICALGNSAVAADSVGCRAADRILVLSGDGISALPKTYILRLGVGAATGISSSLHIKAMAKCLDVSLVICIDALVARTPARIGSLVQITNAGISPGSGVSEHSDAILPEDLGVPIITIGIPTVIRARSGNETSSGQQILYTVSAAERLSDVAGALIGGGVNLYFTRCLRGQ